MNVLLRPELHYQALVHRSLSPACSLASSSSAHVLRSRSISPDEFHTKSVAFQIIRFVDIERN